MTIDPKTITNFDRTPEEKEEFLLFCVLCAGKSSDVMAHKLGSFLFLRPSDWVPNGGSGKIAPFELIESYILKGVLVDRLKEHKIGKYDLISKFCEYVTMEVVKDYYGDNGLLNLTYQERQHVQNDPSAVIEWDRSGLVDIPGVSWKTASLYRMHAFGDRIACLDTHVLRWLRTQGYKGVPKGSPSNWDTYRHWESVFLGECYQREVEPSHFDLALWKEASS